jgi:small subunit ribosomal protein S1
MSWSKRIKHPSEVLKKGDVVEAMVLNIDAENQRLSLASSSWPPTSGTTSSRAATSATPSRARWCA